jgi:hypothetical protein
VLSHHCHLWLRSWGRHLVTSGCIHPTGVPPDQFFIYSFWFPCLPCNPGTCFSSTSWRLVIWKQLYQSN